MRTNRIAELFLLSSGVLLVLFAGSKAIRLATWLWAFSGVHAEPDPVFSFVSATLIDGIAILLELATAAVVFRHFARPSGFYALSYVTALFLTYHLALTTLETPPESCRCGGAAAMWLQQIAGVSERALVDSILAYWGLGVSLWWLHRWARPSTQRHDHFRLVTSLAVLVVGETLGAAQAPGQGIRAEGVVNYKRYDRQAAVLATNTFLFSLARDDTAWRIEILHPNAYREVCMGTSSNVFWVGYEPSKGSNQLAPAKVFPGGYPAVATVAVSVPWLAFCSGSYFGCTNSAIPLPLPWAIASEEAVAHLCLASVMEVLPGSDLPQHLLYQPTDARMHEASRNTNLVLEGVSPSDLFERRIDFRSRYQSSMVLGEYRVTQSVARMAATYPMRFELNRFAPRSLTNWHSGPSLDTNTFRLESYEGFVTSLVREDDDVALTPPVASLSVIDYRMQNRALGVDHVAYRIDDGQWKMSADAHVQALFDDRVRDAKAARHRRLLRQIAMIGLASVVALMPAVVYFRRSMCGLWKTKVTLHKT